MARPSWRTLKAGDLLAIPVDNSRFAVGQVVDGGEEIYLCVYCPLFSATEDIPDLSGVEISLIARTTDELVWHGQWKVIGHQELPSDVPRPYHVIYTPDGLALHNFGGAYVRPANDHDLIFYGYKFNVANIRFSKVMRHIHGIEPYLGDYSRITYDSAIRRASLV